LVEHWITQYGRSETEGLCAASDSPAPTAIRANTSQVTVAKLKGALEKAGYEVEKRTPVPEELTLLGGLPPARTWAFRQGWFIVQDPASMLPAHLLEPRRGDQVLDLCAAPGAKTTHLAALANNEASSIVALDIHERRLAQVHENAARLGFQCADLVCGDGAQPPLRPVFDRILVDAPCSGLGTLRRNPDLKWRIEPGDVARLADLQCALLRSAAQLCKNAGVIVYSVCTITREETEEVVGQILNEGIVEPEDGPEWLNQWKSGTGRYETMPSRDGLDGFFLMRLRKRC
jgi:16S rRNA (cytosine967-C5)-methyltransferase